MGEYAFLGTSNERPRRHVEAQDRRVEKGITEALRGADHLPLLRLFYWFWRAYSEGASFRGAQRLLERWQREGTCPESITVSKSKLCSLVRDIEVALSQHIDDPWIVRRCGLNERFDGLTPLGETLHGFAVEQMRKLGECVE